MTENNTENNRKNYWEYRKRVIGGIDRFYFIHAIFISICFTGQYFLRE